MCYRVWLEGFPCVNVGLVRHWCQSFGETRVDYWVQTKWRNVFIHSSYTLCSISHRCLAAVAVDGPGNLFSRNLSPLIRETRGAQAKRRSLVSGATLWIKLCVCASPWGSGSCRHPPKKSIFSVRVFTLRNDADARNKSDFPVTIRHGNVPTWACVRFSDVHLDLISCLAVVICSQCELVIDISVYSIGLIPSDYLLGWAQCIKGVTNTPSKGCNQE